MSYETSDSMKKKWATPAPVVSKSAAVRAEDAAPALAPIPVPEPRFDFASVAIDGTSEGVKKAWETRKRGGGVRPSLSNEPRRRISAGGGTSEQKNSRLKANKEFGAKIRSAAATQPRAGNPKINSHIDFDTHMGIKHGIGWRDKLKVDKKRGPSYGSLKREWEGEKGSDGTSEGVKKAWETRKRGGAATGGGSAEHRKKLKERWIAAGRPGQPSAAGSARQTPKAQTKLQAAQSKWKAARAKEKAAGRPLRKGADPRSPVARARFNSSIGA